MLLDLIVGTVTLRPYVFAFLGLFLAAGGADLGWRRTVLFGGVVWPIAWLGEFSSTRTGIPFGLYHYTGATRGQELYISNVPFMDALSFTFLAYASFSVARAMLAGRRPSRATLALLAGALMMALDVVIDPLAVRGDRWFLGRIFYYPSGGAYFGVPLSNFTGWTIVGAVSVGIYLVAGAARPPSSAGGLREVPGAAVAVSRLGARVWPGVALYYVVLGFNLAMTAWIREWVLLAVGGVLHAVIVVTVRL